MIQIKKYIIILEKSMNERRRILQKIINEKEEIDKKIKESNNITPKERKKLEKLIGTNSLFRSGEKRHEQSLRHLIFKNINAAKSSKKLLKVASEVKSEYSTLIEEVNKRINFFEKFDHLLKKEIKAILNNDDEEYIKTIVSEEFLKLKHENETEIKHIEGKINGLISNINKNIKMNKHVKDIIGLLGIACIVTGLTHLGSENMNETWFATASLAIGTMITLIYSNKNEFKKEEQEFILTRLKEVISEEKKII